MDEMELVNGRRLSRSKARVGLRRERSLARPVLPQMVLRVMVG